MQVAKWGNSLAIRLPTRLVRDMKLKEGDQVHLLRTADGTLRLLDRAAMDAYLDTLSGEAPPGWTFRREELYDDDRARGTSRKDEQAA
jgi:antitoxin MazE